jgi:mono/diheme cytochrome c family protein
VSLFCRRSLLTLILRHLTLQLVPYGYTCNQTIAATRHINCTFQGEVVEVNMKFRVAVLLLAMLPGTAMTLRGQTPPGLPLDGAQLFSQYCAVCHGVRATGNGPMAAALKTKVPDLTMIAPRNGGTFPLDRVQTVISGDNLPGLSHGTREMPVWGPVFSQDISDRDYGKLRAYNIAKYLESLQKK